MDSGPAGGLAGPIHRLLDRGDAWLARNAGEPLAGVPVLSQIFPHARPSARGILIACAAFILLTVVPPSFEWLLRRRGCVAVNFRGQSIPQSFGLAILVCAGALLALDAWLYPHHAADRLLWLLCISAFGALGFLDDAWGDKKVKGLRGHFAALVRDRRITTGLTKAAGGLATALCVGVYIHAGHPLLILLSTLTIALGANAMNLLDLRPGRACGAFCAAGILLLGFSWRHWGRPTAPALLYVLLAALATWPRDARAKAMLGDTGSNLLGASLGLAVCLYFGVAAQVAFLFGLAALHVLAERTSITKIIEGNSFLRAVDRLTGVR